MFTVTFSLSQLGVLAIMAKQKVAYSTDSAERPVEGTHLRLSELNSATAKTGRCWVVDAFRPAEDNYEYVWNGRRCHGTTLVVTLVAADDRSQYCQAHFRKYWWNGPKYEQAKKAIEHGKRFIMSQVSFAQSGWMPAYVSCPLKLIVNLSQTTMVPCANTPGRTVQPAPTATIASSTSLVDRQCFDVTGVVQEVQAVRRLPNNRCSFVVKIYDGSVDPGTKKLSAMDLNIYFNATPPVLNGLASAREHSIAPASTNSADLHASGESMKRLAEQHLHSKTALLFFCLCRMQDIKGKVHVYNTKHTCITATICKCRLCGRVGNGGYALNGWEGGLVCSGGSVTYQCLNRLTNGDTPNQIVGEALQKILGAQMNTRYPCLAWLVAPWLVNYQR